MKKKTFLKISIAVMVALVTLLAMNAQVFASITSTTNTSSICMEGLEEGVTVTAYRILVVNYDYDADQPSTPMYSWADEAIEEWVEENYEEYLDPEDFAEVTKAATLEAFYSSLAAAIANNEISITAYQTQTAGEDGTVTFTTVAMGQYLLITENGLKVYTPSAVNVVPEYDTENSTWVLDSKYTATVKSTTPQITNTISDETDATASTVDTISYTVTADVPNYAENSISTTFEITGSLTGLTLDTSSIVVKGSDGTVLSAGTAYTITTTATGYTITFDYDKISDYSQVIVTYEATLNSSSLATGSSNSSTATLTYTNNPYSTTSSTQTTTAESTANVYTYGIAVTKLDYEDKETPLAGAEFELSDSKGNTLYFVLVNGVYYLSEDATDNTYTSVLTSDSAGTITIKGLDVGKYYLVETKATDGYNLDSSKIEIELTDEDLDGLLDSDNDTDGIYELTVYNKTGFTLPTTGGIGTIIFAATGVVLVVAGLGIIVISSKKKKNK